VAPAPATILDEQRLAAHGIDHFPGVPVAAIDRDRRAVVLDDGTPLRYERLLLATGARPRRLAAAGGEGIHYLRTWGDALALRDALRPGAHLLIVGGGFIGLEVAASAIGRGCRVTLVEIAPRLLMRGVTAPLAATIARGHREAGVTFHLGAAIEAIEGGAAPSIRLADGTRLEGDAILVGIGAVPETGLAAAAGLAIENGIRVDATLATDDPLIFAAGDCCSFPHGLYGGRRLRLEAWRNAQDQGAAAAANMLGHGRPYEAVPWFWSDQYERTLQIAGLPDEGATEIVRDLGDAEIRFHLASDGRLVAACGLGPNERIARDVRLAEMLIARRATPDPAALAAPGVKLKGLLAA
jgi:3-phenylpropionate/trans-cinnamate dioxygenase ferredoxin reductase subunit